MSAERELWIDVLYTYFEDLNDIQGQPPEQARSRIVEILSEALHPWTRQLCFWLDIDFQAFYRALAKIAKSIMREGVTQ